MDQSSLDFLADSNIDQITISDHAHVTLTLDLPHVASRSWSWRLNKNLLDDRRVVSGMEETLSHYFTENYNGEVSEATLWEGHKAVVRGALIAWGTKVKREKQADFQRVFKALQQAGLLHK